MTITKAYEPKLPFVSGSLEIRLTCIPFEKAIESDPTPNVHLWASWALREIELRSGEIDLLCSDSRLPWVNLEYPDDA